MTDFSLMSGLITHPLIISVLSVRYTFRWVRATVSLNLSGKSNLSSPRRLGEWYKDTLTMSVKFWTNGNSMVLELCSPLEPLVCSKRISTFNNWSEAADLSIALWIHSTYKAKKSPVNTWKSILPISFSIQCTLDCEIPTPAFHILEPDKGTDFRWNLPVHL